MRDLGRYCATRLATPRVIALAVLITGLAIAASRAVTGVMLAQSVALAVLLIAQFRLLDDLADLEHDRRHHPERVLCRVQNTKVFIYALVVLGLGICALLLLEANALKLTVYGLLLLSFVVLYANLRENSNRLLRAHVVLIKYPVFLYLCMHAPVDLSWALLAAVLYYALCVWEIIDDAALRRHKGATAMLVIDTLLLVIALILFYSLSRSAGEGWGEGCSREFARHAARLRNGCPMQRATRPARGSAIRHSSIITLFK